MDEQDVAIVVEMVDDIAAKIGDGTGARTRLRAPFFASDPDATSDVALVLSALSASGVKIDKRRLDKLAETLEPDPVETIRTRNMLVWAVLGGRDEAADGCIDALKDNVGYAIEGLAIAKAATGGKAASKLMKRCVKRVKSLVGGGAELDTDDRTYYGYLTGKEREEELELTASHVLIARAFEGKTDDSDFATVVTDAKNGKTLKRWLDSALVHALLSKRSILRKEFAELYGEAARDLACKDGGISSFAGKYPLDLWVERAFATGSRKDLERLAAEIDADPERLVASSHAVLTPLVTSGLGGGATWPLLLKIEEALIFKKVLSQEDDITFREVGLWLSCAVIHRDYLPRNYLVKFAKEFKPVVDEDHAYNRRWYVGLEYAVALAAYCEVTEEPDAVSQLFRIIKECVPGHASSDGYLEYVMWLASSLYGLGGGEPPEAFLLEHVGRLHEKHESAKGLSDGEFVELLMVRDALRIGGK